MEIINLERASVPFIKQTIDGVVTYTFDTSSCEHPEPMINAMVGLQNLGIDEKLIMINRKAPMGLFSKIEADFNHDTTQLNDGKFQVSFTRKYNKTLATNFEDRSCSGSGCH